MGCNDGCDGCCGTPKSSDELVDLKDVAAEAPKAEEPWSKEKSNLYQHAKRELEFAGLLSKDSDYNGMLGEAALDLIEVFARQGHSGCSAGLTIQLFQLLASFKNLTPITNNPDEWMDVAEAYNGKEAVWQNRRCSSLFSNNGGKTYYDIDDKKREVKLSEEYTPKA